MGREELAANQFRITQTEAKIRREQVRGQLPLERAAEDVGRHVRKTIRDLGNVMPENLPLSSDIKVVKSDLKKTKRAFEKQDKKRLPKAKKQLPESVDDKAETE
jgi:DNA-damage-inducible protein D